MLSFLTNQAGGLLAIALVAAIAALRRLAPDPTHKRELGSAVALFAGYLLAYATAQILAWLDFAEASRYGHVASYVLFAFGSVRVATSLVVWAVRTRRGRVTPKILRDVLDAMLYLTALAVVLRATLKVDLGGLLATSAVLSVVIGLALQETLGNLFAGLALQLEPPFSVGDWITVGAHTGRVLQVAWRHTRIATSRNEQITIPNSAIAKECVTNYSRSGEGVARDLYLELDYDSPPNAVKQACLEVLAAHPKVRKTPAPLFRTTKWEASGVQYQVRYFTDHFSEYETLADELLSQLWYRVRREGFTIPFPTRTVYLQQPKGAAEREAGQRDLVLLLGSVGFLQPLGEESLAKLVALARLQLFGREEAIIRQGETGETFYLIVSGEVAVRTSESREELARLGRGDFFGEMSLLTGEPRTATVVACQDSTLLCVDRKAFGDILRTQEELARALSQALAERSASLKARVAGAPASTITLESNRIFGRLRDIFRLK
ncbi:MAG: mechanosensitive ion channel family protein [Deltaproteobacteria bacterium]|nr:mechanosensitive ion channel family protein [Deltaproteobacteria bacterium]